MSTQTERTTSKPASKPASSAAPAGERTAPQPLLSTLSPECQQLAALVAALRTIDTPAGQQSTTRLTSPVAPSWYLVIASRGAKLVSLREVEATSAADAREQAQRIDENRCEYDRNYDARRIEPGSPYDQARQAERPVLGRRRNAAAIQQRNQQQHEQR